MSVVYHTYLHNERFTGSKLDDYLGRGWFRMTDSLFTTTHIIDNDEFTLKKVWWLRFSLDEMNLHKSHRKILKANSRFRVEFSSNFSDIAAYESLYKMYYASIRFSGYDNVSRAIFGSSADNNFDTKIVTVYDEGKLIAAGIFDFGNDSAASILNFFDPAYADYSPGKYLMLLITDHLKSLGFRHYYPGYVVSGKPKFDYKLFLGRESAYYYDYENGNWRCFVEEILQNEVYTDEFIEENIFIFL